jgi:hypothetical protein
MIEPRTLSFSEDWSDSEFTGAPLTESVLRAFVGRCQKCGCRAEDQQEGSVLVDPLVVDGTLYGDTFCLGCYDDEAEGGVCFVLPPLDVDYGTEREDW